MARAVALLFGAALLLAACGAVRAQEELEVHNWWPEHPTKSFFAGKPASCVLGVRNIGSSTLNVTYALANLASPYNASMNLYNFTSQYLGDVQLAQGGETSAEYSIHLPRQLPPREFILQLTLVYAAAGQFKTKLFFNETIQVIEEPTLFDTQLIGLYIIGLALVGFLAYLALEFGKSKGWVKKSKPAPRPAAISTNKDEWLRGTAADPKLKKRT